VAPFSEGGKGCARLVTTRVPDLLAGRGTAVRVDQMSPEQARALLIAGLPPLDELIVDGLLDVTGRWPLLLRLVGKILADYARVAPDVSVQGRVLLERLRAAGPAVVDDLSGEGRGLDVGDPGDRAKAVRTTIEASTGLLAGGDAARFTELGVFAEDEVISFGLAARLWRATAGLDELTASQVCRRLARLALISPGPDGAGGFTVHDVVRDFLRADLGRQRLAELNGTLLEAAAAGLHAADAISQCPGDLPGAYVAWWDLSDADRYLWDHLIEHLVDAEGPEAAGAVAGDLRWAGARLERFGPAAPAADLAVAGTFRTARLQAVLARSAHLLAPTRPSRAVVDILHSRVADDPDWGPQVTALRDVCPRPRLVNRWLLPDLADLALQRALTGHADTVNAVAVAPDGSWLASGGSDGTLRIWDVATGRERVPLAAARDVTAVAVAPDGSWLVSGGSDGTVRIWDVATSRERATLTDQAGRVTAVAVAPDSAWLAVGGGDGTVRIWDVATSREQATLAGHVGPVMALAVAPDGSWLASGGRDRKVRIWDLSNGQERAALAGHIGRVTALAVAPDGSWLASGGEDGTVRIWNMATGQQRAALTGHANWVEAVAVAPDGSWLASGGRDGTARIWDLPIGQARTTLIRHLGSVTALATAANDSWLVSGGASGMIQLWDVANGHPWGALIPEPDYLYRVEAVAVAPDASWLASGGDDGMVRIWDVDTGEEQATLVTEPDHPHRVVALAVAPDGSWLASGSWDGLRIWDVIPGQERIARIGGTEIVTAVGVAPDGSWLASGGWHGLRIWDSVTGRQRATLVGNSSYIEAVAVAPDGSWLASGGVDGMVRIWDVATSQQRATLSGHYGPVTAIAVTADGSWLASGSEDGVVRIWDVATLKTRAQMRVDGSVNASVWLGSDALAVGGSAGLYLFSFLTGLAATAH